MRGLTLPGAEGVASIGNRGSRLTSSFGWVDYSERDKRLMTEVIDVFGEHETRDEFGIGTIRDALSDLFFPGTNTMQTRAKYFLFVPWIYTALEKKGVRSSDVAARARQDEVALIRALMESGLSDGVIGRYSQERLQRLPSNIYWLGLGLWAIRRWPGGQTDYHQSLDAFYARLGMTVRNDDEEAVDGARRNWDTLPSTPAGFPTGATFDLSADEALYLRDKIVLHCRDSLLAWLVLNGTSWEPSETRYAWEHPQLGEFPPATQTHLEQARSLSLAMHGAALIYNLHLARLTKNEELANEYAGAVERWSELIDAELRPSLDLWKLPELWHLVTGINPRVSPQARRFVERWVRHIETTQPASGLADSSEVLRLLRTREVALKGRRARLSHEDARQGWSEHAGIGRLEYRWPVAQQIALDILSGLNGGPNGA
jgi:Family of unknown function (DUF6361)